jgi:hypothetical protein
MTPKTARRAAAALALTAGVTLALAASFSAGREIAGFPAQLDEISGIAVSRHNPGVFWVHNDSGDKPRAYAVNAKGVLLGTYTLAGANAVDWEDMAIGPAPGGGSYLYMADIGDNNARRSSIQVYRVVEPHLDENQAAATETLTGVTTYNFVYPDGPRDAESFMVDPLTNEFYIVSKRELTGNHLYRSAEPRPDQTNTLSLVLTFPFTGATGADISPDGLQVLIRRYSSATNPLMPASTAASYWSRPDGSVSLPDLLKQPAQIVALAAEVQGEAIGFAADNRGFYTSGERGSGPEDRPLAPLHYYAAVADPPR